MALKVTSRDRRIALDTSALAVANEGERIVPSYGGSDPALPIRYDGCTACRLPSGAGPGSPVVKHNGVTPERPVFSLPGGNF